MGNIRDYADSGRGQSAPIIFHSRCGPHRRFPLTPSAWPLGRGAKVVPPSPAFRATSNISGAHFPLFFLLTYESFSTTKMDIHEAQTHHTHSAGTGNHEARLAAPERHRPRYLFSPPVTDDAPPVERTLNAGSTKKTGPANPAGPVCIDLSLHGIFLSIRQPFSNSCTRRRPFRRRSCRP
jgi:hypothetical protein